MLRFAIPSFTDFWQSPTHCATAAHVNERSLKRGCESGSRSFMWSENRELLIRGARALGDLCHEFVFVGGCTAGLFITDPAAPDVRATRDVDVIAEIASRAEYYAIAKRLRTRGFQEDREIICRWRGEEGLILDVMPTDPDILGFSNVWYAGAVARATEHVIAPETTIRVVTPPYFCATKLRPFMDAATVITAPATTWKIFLLSSTDGLSSGRKSNRQSLTSGTSSLRK